MKTDLIIKRALLATITMALLSACSPTQTRNIDPEELTRYQKEIAQQEQRIESLRADLAQRDAALQSQSQAQSNIDVNSSINDLFPPNPVTGHCYARVLTPANYTTKTEQVLIRDASETVEVSPARYTWIEEQLLVQEASTRLEVTPAEYTMVEERVLVKPASHKLVEVPAEYRKVEESILISPARTEWKRSSSPIAGALQTTSANDNTGEVLCLVEVPAVYETITKNLVASPAHVQRVDIPAEYEMVSKRVVKTPAQTREITIPAKYETRRLQKLVADASEKRVNIPAQYDTVTQRVKVSEEVLNWSDVVCDINMTSQLATNIQRKLQDLNHYSGPIDGIFGQQTMRALNRYSAAKNLPISDNYIPTETIKLMGLNI